ncbi:MAG: hypothetical protein V1880_00090 [Patescibacteria group bacterium]
MSIDKPRGIANGVESFFRKSIRLVLFSSLLAQSTDSNITEPPMEERNNDHLFDGIKIVPDDTPKKRPSEKDKKKPADPKQPSAPFCTSDSCKYA